MTRNKMFFASKITYGKTHFIGLFLILVTGIAIRYLQINVKGLWFDEAVEFWTSFSPFSMIMKNVATTYQPPLYNFLLKIWLRFGISELWMRSLSIFFDSLSIAAAYLLIKSIFNERISIFVGLFLALSPAMIRYSQEAAEYTLVVACLQWFLFAGYKAIKNNSWSNWLYCAILGGLALYSHYGAIILIFSFYFSALIFFLILKNNNGLLKLVITGVILLILCLPILPLFLHQASQQGAFSLVNSLWEVNIVSTFIRGFLKTFSFPITGFPYTPFSHWISYIVIIFVSIIGSTVLFGKNLFHKGIILLFAISFLVYFILVKSNHYGHSDFGFRYMLVLMPAFSLLLGGTYWQMDQITNRSFKYFSQVLFCVFLVIICLISLPNRYISKQIRGNLGWPEVEQVNEVFTYWKRHKSSIAQTYVYYGAVPTFGYYQARDNPTAINEFPSGWVNSCWSAETDSFCEDHHIHYGNWFRNQSLKEKIDSINVVIPENTHELWIIFSHLYGTEAQDIMDNFTNLGFSLIDQFSADGAFCVMFKK